MVNYANGKIYRVVSESLGLQYIGSTCEPFLAKRLGKHRSNYRQYLAGKSTNKVTIYQLLEAGDEDIQLIESYPCKSRDELHAREGYFIRKEKCVNKNVAGRTMKEYKKDNKEKITEYNKNYYKQYYEDNKETITEYQKEWKNDNKETITEYQKEWRKDNKETIKEYKKQYNKDNKEKISTKKSEKIQCECGSMLTRGGMARHKRSQKHKAWEAKQ
jgi:hypothetical protein